MEPSSSLTRGPLGAAALQSPGPLTHGARRAREIDGLVVRVKAKIYDRHSTKRMHAVQAGNPSTSSLTRGPWVPGAALHLTSGPLTCGHAGLEKLMGWLRSTS
jgi:hypothetical protein